MPGPHWRAGKPSNLASKLAAESLGTGVERQPDAERLLTRCAFSPLQLLCNLRCGGFLLRHRLEFTNFDCSPCTPLLLRLRHKTSLSRKAACIPYGSERKANRWVGSQLYLQMNLSCASLYSTGLCCVSKPVLHEQVFVAQASPAR